MKAVTVSVSEADYREFAEHAKKHDRELADLIREAMELYRILRMRDKRLLSIKDIPPLSAGKDLGHTDEDEDRLCEMLVERGHRY